MDKVTKKYCLIFEMSVSGPEWMLPKCEEAVHRHVAEVCPRAMALAIAPGDDPDKPEPIVLIAVHDITDQEPIVLAPDAEARALADAKAWYSTRLDAVHDQIVEACAKVASAFPNIPPDLLGAIRALKFLHVPTTPPPAVDSAG